MWWAGSLAIWTSISLRWVVTVQPAQLKSHSTCCSGHLFFIMSFGIFLWHSLVTFIRARNWVTWTSIVMIAIAHFCMRSLKATVLTYTGSFRTVIFLWASSWIQRSSTWQPSWRQVANPNWHSPSLKFSAMCVDWIGLVARLSNYNRVSY